MFSVWYWICSYAHWWFGLLTLWNKNRLSKLPAKLQTLRYISRAKTLRQGRPTRADPRNPLFKEFMDTNTPHRLVKQNHSFISTATGFLNSSSCLKVINFKWELFCFYLLSFCSLPVLCLLIDLLQSGWLLAVKQISPIGDNKNVLILSFLFLFLKGFWH